MPRWLHPSSKDRFHTNFVSPVRHHLRQRLPTKALLLMDNCSAHPATLTSADQKITVSFLPKNTTTKIQPLRLDQRIMATTKRNYRRHLVHAIIDSTDSLQDYLNSLKIKEAVHLFSRAWGDVSSKAILECWNKGLGFDEENLLLAVCGANDYNGFNDDDISSSRQDVVLLRCFGDYFCCFWLWAKCEAANILSLIQFICEQLENYRGFIEEWRESAWLACHKSI